MEEPLYSAVNKGILWGSLNGSDIAVYSKEEIHTQACAFTHTHTFIHTCQSAEAVSQYRPCDRGKKRKKTEWW